MEPGPVAEALTARRKAIIRNEAMIDGMMGARTIVRHLDISGRDRDIVLRAIEKEMDKLSAIVRELRNPTITGTSPRERGQR